MSAPLANAAPEYVDPAAAEEFPPGHARRTVRAIVAMLAYQGFVMAINGVGSPWIAKSFDLTDSQIAALFAWISISAIGALVLSRVADRVGRRRVLLWCMVATPLSAAGAALSTDLLVFCTVAGNAAATELFPTALRGTMMGWFAFIAAVGAVFGQAAIALLTVPLGGLSTVVGYLSLLGIPSAIIFGTFIEETRGLSLEVAARETI